MESLSNYFILSSVCLAIFYLFYTLILKKTNAYKTIRFYILFIVTVSLLLPLTNYRIEIQPPADSPEYFETGSTVAISNQETDINKVEKVTGSTNSLKDIVLRTYVGGALILLISFIWQLILIFKIRFTSRKHIMNSIQYFSGSIKTPFSFFFWIFIPKPIQDSEDIKQIISHENIHAVQFHSIDIVLIEILKIIFWFNPVIWLLRKEIKQNHEFIADQGVIETGIDKVEYQTLLLNQIAEEKLLTLPSGFNHSLIKKRIAMMTKNKIKQKTGLRLLGSLPILAILFFGISVVNGQVKEEPALETEPTVAVAPDKMNVLYCGVNNPISIAVSGYAAEDLRVEMTNGKITGEKGKYIANPARPGNCFINIYNNNDIIGKKEFRVKMIPDPVATIGGNHSGRIERSELLKHKGIQVELPNFMFDVSYKVVSFVVSSTVIGEHIVMEDISYSEEFSPAQKKQIKNLVSNQKLMIEEIKVIGPDGSTRKLSPLVFTIE